MQLGLIYADFLIPTFFACCSTHPSSTPSGHSPLKRVVDIFKKSSVSWFLCREKRVTGIPQPGICLNWSHILSKVICLLPLSPVIPNSIFCLLFYSPLLSSKSVLPDTRGYTPAVPSNWPLPFVFTALGFCCLSVAILCYIFILGAQVVCHTQNN